MAQVRRIKQHLERKRKKKITHHGFLLAKGRILETSVQSDAIRKVISPTNVYCAAFNTSKESGLSNTISFSF